ncbi:MAG: hypothetical protein O2967_07930 [Proteobacteria bacterium]|nr:hypothetical protein [Pseudomonadota bacterium]
MKKGRAPKLLPRSITATHCDYNLAHFMSRCNRTIVDFQIAEENAIGVYRLHSCQITSSPKTVVWIAMAKYHVTLKASLSDGDLYWVTDVTAESEDSAMDAAEVLFTQQISNATEWAFSEADVERL